MSSNIHKHVTHNTLSTLLPLHKAKHKVSTLTSPRRNSLRYNTAKRRNQHFPLPSLNNKQCCYEVIHDVQNIKTIIGTKPSHMYGCATHLHICHVYIHCGDVVWWASKNYTTIGQFVAAQ